MGRDSSSLNLVFAYGIVIKLPKDPSWPILEKRLKAFEYDTSLFATAARSVLSKKDSKEVLSTELPEQISESAKGVARPVLISQYDQEGMTESEREIKHSHYDTAEEFGIEREAARAITKILGEDHGLALTPFCASSGYEEDDGVLDPVLLLHYDDTLCRALWYEDPGAYTSDLNLPTLDNKDEMNQKISQVLGALGLEATSSAPGWRYVATNSCMPR